MQNKKRPLFFGMLLLCLVVAAGRVADLCLATDPATSFVTAGSAWWRYLPLLGLAALAWLLSRFAAQRPAAFFDKMPLLGVPMFATGALLGAGALAAIPLFLEPGSGWLPLVSSVTMLLGAVWFLLFASRAFTPPSPQANALPGVAGSLLGLAPFAWALLYRFAVAPAAVTRLGCTLRVLSSLAAVLFMAALFKVFYTPGLPAGRALFASGISSFALCGCVELPQALFDFVHGSSALVLVWGLAMAALGLCGLACAWYATGADTPLPPPEKAEKPKKSKTK